MTDNNYKNTKVHHFGVFSMELGKGAPESFGIPRKWIVFSGEKMC
ncbi:hypothetical protein [Oceanobacillus sojae]